MKTIAFWALVLIVQLTAVFSQYDTYLTPNEEASYQTWKAQYAPGDSGDDYDLRGAFKAGYVPDATGHWPDTFKKPNHPTFSIESIYHISGDGAGCWIENTYTKECE